MKKYLVIAFDEVEDCYVVDDLDKLIKEMYNVPSENRFEDAEKKFYMHHKVFKIEGTFNIDEIN